RAVGAIHWSASVVGLAPADCGTAAAAGGAATTRARARARSAFGRRAWSMVGPFRPRSRGSRTLRAERDAAASPAGNEEALRAGARGRRARSALPPQDSLARVRWTRE